MKVVSGAEAAAAEAAVVLHRVSAIAHTACHTVSNHGSNAARQANGHLSPSGHLRVRTKVKVKFSRTRYRALGPELIPVYRQSARR